MGQAMRQVAYAVPARLCPLGIRRASRAMPLAYALLFLGQAMRQVAYAVPARLCPLGIRRDSRAMPLAYALP